ncbi:hypothetical protein X734_30900 [Mesorhizobium sp. L2C084A000]|nr:hypothetical protein X734_30900 [Mesorhizobium sp. L2C084A000]
MECSAELVALAQPVAVAAQQVDAEPAMPETTLPLRMLLPLSTSFSAVILPGRWMAKH